MKLSKFLSCLSVSAVTLATTLITSRPSFSQQRSFFCGRAQDGSPATIVSSPQYGEVPIIAWNSGYFQTGGYDDQTRCDIVSQKFQSFYDRGTLKEFTYGRVNRQPVICAVSMKGEPCNSDSLLFTLKPYSNAQETLQKLFDIRSRARNQPLNENGNEKAGDRLYVNFEEFLERKANTESGSSQELSPANNNLEDNSNSDFVF